MSIRITDTIVAGRDTLAKVWLAAHAKLKLSKSAVLVVNVVASCGALAHLFLFSPLSFVVVSCRT